MKKETSDEKSNDKNNKKKSKKLIAAVSTIVTLLAGAGASIPLLNSENNSSVSADDSTINQNTGVTIQGDNYGAVIDQNNGVVKNYEMGGGTTRTNDKETNSTKDYSDYEPTYITTDEALIKTRDNSQLEGVIIDSYSYRMDSVSFETLLDTDIITISFGPDHPNGFNLSGIKDGRGQTLMFNIPQSVPNTVITGGEINEGSKIQISPYDFDLDGNPELLVCIKNSIDGLCFIFSYTHVDSFEKINPFKLEECVYMQGCIYLDGNSLQAPYGSVGLFSEYKYVDEHFVKFQ